MSTMGFEVHVDKENATYVPGINKGGVLKAGGLKAFGLKDSKGKTQPTPRKALVDVNYETVNVAASKIPVKNKLGSSSTNLKEESFSTLKPAILIPSGVENAHVGAHNKKQEAKKTPSVQKREFKVLKDTGLHPPKSKPTAKPKKPKPQPKQESEDEEYDSDCIFPRSERLSSYAEKLLLCSFPCLLGPAQDSQSDSSDIEELRDDFVLDMPTFLPIVPEFSDADLDSLMQDFPPEKPEEISFEDHEGITCQDRDPNLLTKQAVL